MQAEQRLEGGAHSCLAGASIDDGHNGRPEEQLGGLMARGRGTHEPRPRPTMKIGQEDLIDFASLNAPSGKRTALSRGQFSGLGIR